VPEYPRGLFVYIPAVGVHGKPRMRQLVHNNRQPRPLRRAQINSPIVVEPVLRRQNPLRIVKEHVAKVDALVLITHMRKGFVLAHVCSIVASNVKHLVVRRRRIEHVGKFAEDVSQLYGEAIFVSQRLEVEGLVVDAVLLVGNGEVDEIFCVFGFGLDGVLFG
jgi:hypothetical protein